MNFKLTKKLVYTGITDKGNTIQFPVIKEAAIDSVFTLSCSFRVTPQMADLLETSKIVRVESFSSGEVSSTVKLSVLFGFDTETLKDIIFDMCQKHEL